MMEKTDKIYVAGHRGLVGSAIVRNLESKGYTNIIGRTHRELDLTNQQQVRDFFEEEKPDVVVLAAAKVGGIMVSEAVMRKRTKEIFDELEVKVNEIDAQGRINLIRNDMVYENTAPARRPEGIRRPPRRDGRA